VGYIISGGSVNIDNNTIKKNAQGELYVNAVSPLSTTNGVGIGPSKITNISKGIPNPPSTIPSGISPYNYLQINITNNQSTATSTNFQQLIQINGLPQPPDEAEFFDANGNIYTSWLESYNNGVATWWVLLPNGIGANSTVTLYLGFSSSGSTLLNGTTVGASPTWTNIYAQYDNGASLFPSLYQNFAGTTLNSNWATGGANGGNPQVSQNNGVTLTFPGGTLDGWFYWNANLTFPAIFDWYGTPYTPTTAAGSTSGANNGGWGIGLGSEGGDLGEQPKFGVGSYGINTSAFYLDGNSSLATNWAVNPPATGVYSVGISSNSAFGTFNYENQITDTSVTPSTAYNIGWGYGSGATSGICKIQWARLRAYPPNGIMPSIQAYSPIYQFISTSGNLSNKNMYSNYDGQSTSSTTPITIQSINFTPSINGLVKVRVIAKVFNSNIGDGVQVRLINNSTIIDYDMYTQEGSANNPHYIILYSENLYPIGTQQTFSVQFNAITGGTAYCEIQEFSVEEVY